MVARPILILGIESSCDESGVALLEFSADSNRARVIGEKLYTQISIHQEYGGVVPELAAREHLTALPLLTDALLKEVGYSLSQLSAIAVTSGPGLKGCLMVGVDFARGLALATELPVFGVNHIEGHCLVPMLDNPELTFPYLALVVSGGHTELLAVRGVSEYEIIARTGDDAAGEAFDKSANLLGFGYPGGAKLAKLADATRSDAEWSTKYQLPKVMREQSGFSFSGLKTAISLLVKREGESLSTRRGEIAAAIQESIIEALVDKVTQVVQERDISRIVVTGGVAANRRLRERIGQLSTADGSGVRTFFPTLAHCTDNAAMIAYVGGLRFTRFGIPSKESLKIRPRWGLEELSV